MPARFIQLIGRLYKVEGRIGNSNALFRPLPPWLALHRLRLMQSCGLRSVGCAAQTQMSWESPTGEP